VPPSQRGAEQKASTSSRCGSHWLTRCLSTGCRSEPRPLPWMMRTQRRCAPRLWSRKRLNARRAHAHAVQIQGGFGLQHAPLQILVEAVLDAGTAELEELRSLFEGVAELLARPFVRIQLQWHRRLASSPRGGLVVLHRLHARHGRAEQIQVVVFFAVLGIHGQILANRGVVGEAFQ